MKTDDLINMLADEPALPTAPSLDRRAGQGIAIGLLGTLALFFAVLGARPDLLGYLAQPVVLAKTALPLVLGALAVVLGLRAVRPGQPWGATARAIFAVPLAALALFIWAYVSTPDAARMALFIGHSIPVCLPAIVLLSLPITAGFTWAMRHGAPLRPMLSGAIIGLAGAGLATALYSTFCTEDSPLFYAVWYSLGILLAAGAGALMGRRWLRW